MALKPKSNSAAGQKPKASWRSSPGRGPAPTKLWSAQSPKDSLVLSNGIKLFISLTLLLGLSLFFILFLLRGNNQPTILVFPITEYAYPWSPNSWARQDAVFLQKMGKSSKKFTAIIAEDRQEQPWNDWLSHPSNLNNPKFIAGGPGGSVIFPQYQSLAVYISGHVELDSSATPCLLFPKNKSIDPSIKQEDARYGVEPVELKKVLSTISSEMDARPKHWWCGLWNKSHRKLIVLDIGKLNPRLQTGAPSEKLHDSINNVVKEMADPNLAVIVSCGQQERSWTLPDRGGSNFGLHFAHAMAGAADRSAATMWGARITLKKLVNYLEKHVNQTAQLQLATSQTPVCLFGDGQEKSFEIAFAGSASPKDIPSTQIKFDGVGTQKVKDQWDRFSEWQSQISGLDPWIVSEARNRLANAEGLLLAGPTYTTDTDALNNQLAEIDRILSLSPVPQLDSVDGQSRVLLMDRDNKSIPAEDQQKITDWLDAKILPDGKPMAEPPTMESRLALAAIWNWLSPQQELTDERWSRAVSLFKASKSNINSAPVSRDELLFGSMQEGLQAARNRIETDKNSASSETISRMIKGIPMFLQAHKKLQEVNQIEDPRLCLWLDSQSGLHRRFFEALDFWILATADGLIQSEQILEKLVNSHKKTLIDIAIEQKSNLQIAWKLHDELAMWLPNLAWLLKHGSSLSEGLVISPEELESQAKALLRLRKDLVQSLSEGQESTTDKFQDIGDLKRDWDRFKNKFLNPTEKLAETEDTIDPAARRDMILWLEQPLDLPKEARTKLREKLVKHLSSESNSDTRQENESATKQVGDNITGTTPKKSVNTDGFNSYWWQAISIERSVSDSVDDSIRDLTSPDLNASLSRKQIYGVQTNLVSGAEKAVTKFTRDTGKKAEATNESWRIAWSSRLLAPFIVQSNPSETRSVCPTRHHWAIASQLSMISLAKQSLDDFWIEPTPVASAGSMEFYANLANNLIVKAETFPISTGTIEAGLSIDALTKDIKTLLKDRVTSSQAWRRSIWQNVPTDPVKDANLTITVKGLPGTILNGDFPNAPIIINQEDSKPAEAPQIRMDFAKSGSNRNPLKAFLRGRSSEKNVLVAGVSISPEAKLLINQSKEAKIRVSADTKPRQILFVLDCSNSFTVSDHEKAKEVLLRILNDLPPETTEVGLIVFGHRSQWKNVIGETRPLRSGVVDNSITPENDVELVVPIQSLAKETTKSDFENQLSLVKPYSQTPLFKSIDQGREELLKAKQRSPGFEQHLVVITDGADNVYKVKTKDTNTDVEVKPGRFQFTKAPSSIKTDLAKENIKLQVIKYKYDDADRADTKLLQLVDRDFVYDADDANALNKALQTVLGIRNFSVFKDGKRIEEVRFNMKTKGIPLDGPTKLQIQVVNEPEKTEVLANAGDFFDIEYDAVNRTFKFLRLKEQEFEKLIVEDKDDKETRRWRVSELPRGTDALVSSPRFSIQPDGDDRKPPLKPSKIWIEMKIVPEGSTTPQRVFLSDVQWESDKNSPVFRLPLEQAEIQEVRVWFSFTDNRSNFMFWGNWEQGKNELSKVLLPPVTNPTGNQWELKFTSKSNTRIRLALEPVSSGAIKAPSLKFVNYAFSSPPTQSYTFSSEPNDVKIKFELMPAEDRPNTDGWLTTDWLKLKGR